MENHAGLRAGLCVPILLVLAVVSLGGLGATAEPQAVAYQEDFEDGQAPGWNLDPGWQVESDGANQVLAGQGHVWARLDQSFEGDLRQSFRIKLLQGRIHLVVRLTEAHRYYIGFDAEGSDLNKQYFPSEFHEGLAGLASSHSFGRWYQVDVVSHGGTLELWVDGVRQWSYADPLPLSAGSLAFETLDDSTAYVDDIAILAGASQPAGPSAPPPTALPPVAVPTAAGSSPTSLTWVRTGGPLGGLGYDIRMRPDNPDRMFVTDAWAGVFASNDGGQTWFPSSDGITTRTGPSGDAIPVFSLTIDPNNPEIVWAGTQFLRGIFKSIDGGRSWKKMDGGVLENDGITFRGFSIQPGNSDIVYAAAEISSWTWAGRERPGREFDLTRGVVYKTTNGGLSWNAAWRGDNLARYIWIDPRNTDVLYISTGFFDREAANSDPVKGVPGGEGILKSTDGGKTWQAINNGLNNLYVTSLFMNPSDPDILLAATGNIQYPNGGGVYLTTDGGAYWTHTLRAGNSVFEAVEFASANPSIAYAGSNSEIYRSEDRGHTWQRVSGGEYWGSPGVRAGFPIDFQVDPRDSDRLFANEYGGGNFLSVDGGKTWADVSRGYTGAQARDIAVDPSAPGPVITAARSGIFASYDGGRVWIGLNNPPAVSMEWNAVAIDPRNPQHLLAGTNWNGLMSSDSAGRSWELAAEMPSNRTGWRAIAFAPSDPSTVYAGTAGYYSAGVFNPSVPGRGIYVSHNGGKTWMPVNDGVSADAHVAALAVDPSDSQRVFAATLNHGLLRTMDGGQEWKTVGALGHALSVAFDPSDSNIIFAGLDRGGIYRSTDGGTSWKRASSGLSPEASVADIVFDPANPAVLYAASQQSGVYRSVDGGTKWMAINNGLLSRTVNALALTRDGFHLYAATEGGGTFRLDLNGQPPEIVSAPQTPQPSPTATAYQYQAGSPTPGASARGVRFCGGAMLPFALIGLGFLWRRNLRDPR